MQFDFKPVKPIPTISVQSLTGCAGELLVILETRWPGTSSVRIPEDLELSEVQWRVIALMAKEGLNNAVKHGRASLVEFEIEVRPKETVATLFQNGRKTQEPAKFGYGLSRLQEAAESVGGDVTLQNGASSGTILKVSLPKEPCAELPPSS